jgi:hypothetical protein
MSHLVVTRLRSLLVELREDKEPQVINLWQELQLLNEHEPLLKNAAAHQPGKREKQHVAIVGLSRRHVINAHLHLQRRIYQHIC